MNIKYDQYTPALVTKQRRYQLRRANEGKCIICGDVTSIKLLCETHREKKNARRRANNEDV